MDFSRILEGGVLAAVAAFFFVTLLDTAGTLLGVGMLAGFVDKDGDLPRANRAFAADAISTTLGACLGTSPMTCLHRVGDRDRGGRAHRAHRGDGGAPLPRRAGVRADLRRGAGGGDRARAGGGGRADDARRDRDRVEAPRRGDPGVSLPGRDAVHVLDRERARVRDRVVGRDPRASGRARDVKLPLWLLATGLCVFLFFLEPVGQLRDRSTDRCWRLRNR